MSMASLVSVIISFLMALLAMAFYTLMERKFLGYFHLRKGPNKVGLMGIPQPLSDALKLFLKEQATPTNSNKYLLMLAPIMGLVLSLMSWAIFPHSFTSFWMEFGVLYFLCISSMNVYSTFIAGWSSNSKYSLLGALRGVAQTISYEVSMSLILMSVLIMNKTLDFSLMYYNYTFVAFLYSPLLILWFITNLAETNRTPFDFAEGESELVSGFNVEYSSGLFALIFMAEYANILVMSLFTSIMFFSSVSVTLIMMTLLISSLFIWVRATLPRMRYDALMMLTWKGFLPFSLASLSITLSLVSLMS